MSEWKLINEDTPRGRWENRAVPTKRGTIIHKTIVPDRIEVVGADCVIRISYWCREREAWNFYTKKNPPKYWKPLDPLPEEYQ